MYSIYAVVIDEKNTKFRHFIGRSPSLFFAKHKANCATVGNAAYAYVKDIDGSTVFYIKQPEVNDPDRYKLTHPTRLRPVSQEAWDQRSRTNLAANS